MSLKTLRIPAGQQVTDTLTLLSAGHLAGIYLPAVWTAADLSFDVSWDGVTFYPAVDHATNAELIVKGGPALGIMLPPAMFLGAAFLRIRSGTHAAGVNQTAERLIQTWSRQYA